MSPWTGKNPRVSVVMPVYNCARYLREAIESILNQTFENFEFIIVNDGSTDETPEILNTYANKDSRIKIINQPNSGLVIALNRGIRETEGEWVFRMDGDDISLSHRFAVQIEAIQKNPSLVLLGGWCRQINEEGVPLKINRYPSSHDSLVHCLETIRPFFPHPTACFRKDIVIRIGGYRERFPPAEDVDLWLRLIVEGEIACIENVILQLRKHKDNISIRADRLQQLRSVAARICHFRRKAGLSDLSKMEEDVWQGFVKWVEERLEGEGYFRRIQGWQALWNAWYSNLDVNKFKRTMLVLKILMQNPSARKAFLKRFKEDDLILGLAEESRGIFNS